MTITDVHQQYTAAIEADREYQRALEAKYGVAAVEYRYRPYVQSPEIRELGAKASQAFDSWRAMSIEYEIESGKRTKHGEWIA